MMKPSRAANTPPIDRDVDVKELDRQIRRDLRSLPKELAERVGGRLVMAQRLLEESPELAVMHAQEARRLASRLAVVREALGVAAYYAGQWNTALTELRAARRIAGSDAYLPMIMDAERASGQYGKARDVYETALNAKKLDTDVRAELSLVMSGILSDEGDADAARETLVPWLDSTKLSKNTRARVRYAYAELLTAAEKSEEAYVWFQRASTDDPRGETPAASRMLELDGFALDGIETHEETSEEEAEQQHATVDEARAEK